LIRLLAHGRMVYVFYYVCEEINMRDTSFKFIDLFAGIGGFRTAFERLGGQCVFSSEINPFAQQAYNILHGEVPAGDIRQVQADDIPDFDLLCGGFPCFAAGELVTTSMGMKPIEDIKKGDYVLTHKNRFRKVVMPMVKHKQGIFRLSVLGSPSTFVTEEHPYYVRRYTRVWNNDKRTYERVWGPPEWKAVKDLTKEDYVGFATNKKAENIKNLTAEQCWLLGRYVADGYIRNYARKGRQNSHHHIVTFCIGKHKLDNFRQRVTEYSLGVTEEKTSYKCRIINEHFMNLCIECGRGAHNKQIPGYIMDLPEDLLQHFLDGYISGDGDVNKNNVIKATTVSRQLAYQVSQAVQKVYKKPCSIIKVKTADQKVIEGRVVNQSDYFQIRFKTTPSNRDRSKYLDDMLWCPVKDLTWIPNYDSVVHNFEVEEDNSYVVNNCVVHNCQAFSFAGKRLGFADETRGTLFFEIARIAEAKKPKYLFLENVKGLVNHEKGRTLDTIVRTLSDLGYSVDFEVINSKYYGVPQNRERIYIVGVLDGEVSPYVVSKKKSIISAAKKRQNEYGDIRSFNFAWPTNSEVTTSVRDIMEDNVDDIFYMTEDKTEKLIDVLTNRGYFSEERLGRMEMVGLLHYRGTDQTRRVYDANGLAPTLTAHSGGSTEPKVLYSEDIMEFSMGDGITCCVDASYSKGVSPNCVGKGRRTHIVEPNSANLTPKWKIRKLTPVECFRLQSFPESSIIKLKQSGIKNTQLYRMAGNSVTVNVIQSIGTNIVHLSNGSSPVQECLPLEPQTSMTCEYEKNEHERRVSKAPSDVTEQCGSFTQLMFKYIKHTKIVERKTTTDLYNDVKSFANELNISDPGLSNPIYFGTIMKIKSEELANLGIRVNKSKKHWSITRP